MDLRHRPHLPDVQHPHPELVDSTKTLADNFESYYKTVYNWVNSLVENQAIFSDDIYSDQLLSALNGYYDKLVKWVTDTVIPQAQVAIVAVTGGIWSVVIFLKNLLIGMMISVYLLARKESFAKQSKKILFAILPETPYRRTLRAVAEADRIFSGFVRGKLLDSLIIGILCFICCSIFKFPYTPIISVFVGVTNIIPIFGPFLGAIPSAFLILLVSPKQCLYFILFIIALQQFDGNILGAEDPRQIHRHFELLGHRGHRGRRRLRRGAGHVPRRSDLRVHQLACELVHEPQPHEKGRDGRRDVRPRAARLSG